ncbi:phage tail sheath subtilisin-like domain-containing protein [Candidatus Bathyarchaeota archaeon]|nr:phage tail sheath subtilisin-like domain-containing protein [Candidatus Bathyarchaeota archaeon]
MAFQVSPGVLVQERDLTNIIPAVSTSIGAVAGQFGKGPVDEIISISSEQELVDTFGKPDSTNFEYFFTAANFLQYSNALRVVRAQNTSVTNATASGSSILIKNTDDYTNNYSTGQGVVGTFAARTAGTHGNSLLVSTCPSATAYEQISDSLVASTSTTNAVGNTSIAVDEGSDFNVGDIIQFSTTASTEDFDDGDFYRITAISSETLTFVQHPRGSGGLKRVVLDDSKIKRRWRYYDSVDRAPGTSAWTSDRSGSGDEIHVVVVDEDGDITGEPGRVLETFSNMSKASDAKTPQGDNNYYPDVIYNKSSYIYWMDHNTSGTNWGNAATGTTFTAVNTPTLESLSGGAAGSTVTDGQLKTAYEKFQDAETVDVGLIMSGPSGSSTHIDNLITIAENRKDAVVFASPQRSDVVNITNTNTQMSNVIDFFNNIRSSSYVVFDSGYKYAYDRYNDVYRFVPLNGDIAGLSARTDTVADSWFSPAGFNRGIIRGAVKLAFNPTKSQRDQLYPARINPVATFPGQGTILFGDKTGLTTPSAFDRINVRRLFIVLEKAISTASKFQLFEFNDEFTRANFRNIVEPFLREVQGRRGITDFLVVCDETNNTGEVIDRNEFIAEIFIKPARSINFITLSFVATRTGVSFDEVAG